jgi:hypothetical protein
MSIKEINVARNSMPAEALISLSFKTRMLYPSTFSPNWISLFIFYFLLPAITGEHFCFAELRRMGLSQKIKKLKYHATARRRNA